MNLIKKEIKEWVEFFIRNIPGKIGFFFRSTYYKLRIKSSLKKNRFELGLRIEYPKNVELGSNSYFEIDCKIYASEFRAVKIGFNASINSNVMINARGKRSISIGNNVLIGPNVVLRSSNHSFYTTKIPVIDQGMTEGEIVINDDLWIGSNAVILPNCEIDKGGIIAVGAVVTSDVESYTIVGGVPATLIKKKRY